MAVKSIIDIQVNDEDFKRFKALFDDYKSKLAETPAGWGAAGGEIKASQVALDGVVAAMFAQTEILKHLFVEQQHHTSEVEKSGRAWDRVASTTRKVSDNILSATTTLLRWASLGGIFSGLLGAGGLWGLDKLAGGVGNTRRTAQGLGATYGEQKAFGLDFGRYVDTDALTGGVNDALTDPRKWFALKGAGAKQEDIASGDAVRVAASLIPNLKQIADQTQDQYLALEIEKRGLQGIVSVETLRRLKTISPEELNKAGGEFDADAQNLGLKDADARGWQDFTVQLSRAGQEIENVFVKALIPLKDPLIDLSKDFADLIKALLGSDTVKEGITKVGEGMEWLAREIGTDEFRAAVVGFVEDIGKIAVALKNAVVWIASKFGGGDAGDATQGAPSAPTDPSKSTVPFLNPDFWGLPEVPDWLKPPTGAGPSGAPTAAPSVPPLPAPQDVPYAPGARPSSPASNPGGLRNPGGSGFQSFPTSDAGVLAISRQLLRYEDRDHLDTIRGIITKYAPPNENDTAKYIKDVAARTGFNPDKPLDLHDNAQLAKLVAAITKQEGVKAYSPGTVVTILNQTGGNTIVTTSQLVQ